MRHRGSPPDGGHTLGEPEVTPFHFRDSQARKTHSSDADVSMKSKIPISKLIEGLDQTGLYDLYTRRKLDLLTATAADTTEIRQKERVLTRQLFSSHLEQIEKDETIRFEPIFESGKGMPHGQIVCRTEKFLGYGNMGPVYSVTVADKSYALKIYSAREIKETMQLHGSFGLGGVLQNLEDFDKRTTLNELGSQVLARKPKGAYGRAGRIVKIQNIGRRGDYLYVLMDLLAVDPINKLDTKKLGGNSVDLLSWAVDCAVGLCNLHAEERRLHLNIRPEAFIKREVKDKKRFPRYTFFNYPKEFRRPPGSPCLTTEFILVDHFDTSIDIQDKTPKGLGTVGSWLFMPPETILGLVKILRHDYEIFVERRQRVENARTITMRRGQMDDIWALGLTYYEFLSGGKSLLGEPRSLGEMVSSMLLTKFDYSDVDPLFRPLLGAMLEKDRKARYLRILENCPSKIRASESAAEAVLYKLEEIALKIGR